MMKKIKSIRFQRIKSLAIIPILAILTITLSAREVKIISPADIVSPEETIVNGKKHQVEVLGQETIADSPAQQAQTKVEGSVKNQKGEPLPGVTVIIKGTTIGVTTNREGHYSLSLPEGEHTLLFSMVGMKAREEVIGKRTTINVVFEDALENEQEDDKSARVWIRGISETALVFIDGNKASKSDLNKLNPDSISSISIQKDENEVAILTKAYKNKILQDTQSAKESFFEVGKTTAINLAAIDNNGEQPLIIIDGNNASTSDLSKLKPNNIESFVILKKGNKMLESYGEEGKNGVIIIKTR